MRPEYFESFSPLSLDILSSGNTHICNWTKPEIRYDFLNCLFEPVSDVEDSDQFYCSTPASLPSTTVAPTGTKHFAQDNSISGLYALSEDKTMLPKTSDAPETTFTPFLEESQEESYNSETTGSCDTIILMNPIDAGSINTYPKYQLGTTPADATLSPSCSVVSNLNKSGNSNTDIKSYYNCTVTDLRSHIGVIEPSNLHKATMSQSQLLIEEIQAFEKVLNETFAKKSKPKFEPISSVAGKIVNQFDGPPTSFSLKPCHIKTEHNAMELHLERRLPDPILVDYGKIDGKKILQTCGSGRLKTGHKNKQTDKNDTRNSFVCDDCGLSFKRKDHLKRHKEMRHATDDISVFCSLCGRKFANSITLKNHLKSAVRKTSRTSNFCKGRSEMIYADKRLRCNFCTQLFSSKSSLNRHCYKKHFQS